MTIKTEAEDSGVFDMLTRILTAAVSLVVFIAVLLLPEWVFIIALAAIMGFMSYESIDCAKPAKSVKIAGGISAVLLILGYIFKILAGEDIIVMWSVIMAILIHCVVVVYEHGDVKYTDIFASCLFIIYIVLSMSCVGYCRAEHGTGFMMLIFVCSWMTDTGAYFVGSFMGKHKLIPEVSPKKTVEGAIGGVIVCMLSCFVYSLIISNIVGWPLLNTGTIAFVIMGMIASVASQFGDLAASAIKRDLQIKDFGNIFPGHGGFMDRFDSVMFVAPIIYGMYALFWG